MFVVLLKFSQNKNQASQFMAGHNEWLQRGFDEGVFMLAGSLKTTGGGAVLAHNTDLTELERRVAEDPFVSEQVVTPEIIEVEPKRADQSLMHLMN